MPAVRLKKRVSPTGQFARPQQVNGLYIHSSPPKGHFRLMADIEDYSALYVHTCPPRVLQMNPSVIRQWLRGGEIDQLEQVVLEGQGHKLIGEYAPDPKVRAFLKEVPTYIARIGELNDAVNKGSLKQLQKLEPDEMESYMKNVMLCKDHSGVGLLHKAVYNDHPEIVKWLLKRHPDTVSLKDRDGKTALHYCGVCGDPDAMWNMLLQAGADPTVMDARGHPAAYYMERPGEIELPEPKLPSPSIKRFTSAKGLVVKPSNIRIWIHDRDLGRLQQVLWEGHGAKLRVETSNNPKVKKFLDGVPYIMNIIKDVHAAAINDDLQAFIKKTSDPIPVEILTSKDSNGLTPLHKAAGLGHIRIVQEIVERLPKSVFATDLDGRTPMHYAVIAKDSGQVYKCLRDNGADEMVFDLNGKMPSYYKLNPKDIPTKLLEVVPEAPRMSQTMPPSFDWSLLQPSAADAAGALAKLKFNDGFGPKEDGVDIWQNNGNHYEDEEAPQAIPYQALLKPVANGLTSTFNTDKKKEEEERKAKEKAEEDAKRKEKEKKEAEEKKRREDETKRKEEAAERERLRQEEEARRRMEAEELRRLDEESKRMEQEEADEYEERLLAEERQRLLDEGLVRPPGFDEQEEDDDGSEDEEVKKLIRDGEMEALATLVLEGEGKRLLGHRSKNPEIQGFLENVPVYMTKIEAVHKAARDGELRAMQAALDRRRFAVAKDTPLKVTPLHIATLFGKTPIIKYLGGRFPETLRATDKDGRTALHYAACIPDNGHYFNMLLNLGADRKLKDNFNRVPQYYMSHPGELTQDMLLRDLSVPSQVANEMLSDKVPDDKVSSRRHLQDKDTLAMLDKCMDIIESARKKGSTMPLVKHLTRSRYSRIKDRITRHDQTLLDVMWPGIRILQDDDSEETDWGNSGGIVAPDFETYVVFEDLIAPMLKDLHGLGGKIDLHPDSVFFKKEAADAAKELAKIADPDGGGIVAPDTESYQVYKEAVEPIVKDIHGIEQGKNLKKHPDPDYFKKDPPVKMTRTQKLREEHRLKKEEEAKKGAEGEDKKEKKKEVNILVLSEREPNEEPIEEDAGMVLDIMNLDPSNKYVLSARVDCTRNLEKYSLPKTMPTDELELVQKKLQSALKYQSVVAANEVILNGEAIQGFSEKGDETERFFSLYEILTGPTGVRTKMAANDLLIPLTDASDSIHNKMLHGNSWPEFRGVYLSGHGNLAAWVNVQDHLRIVSCSRIDSPGNIGEAYGRLAHLVSELDKHLSPKRDPMLGFLTSRPAVLGNTMKLQVVVRLPRLPEETISEMCESANLVLTHSDVGDKVYKITNRQTLGIAEYDTYDNFTSTVLAIVTEERSLAQEKGKQVSKMLKNMFTKNFNKEAAEH